MNNTATSTFLYAELNDIQTVPLPIPSNSRSYPANNPQRYSRSMLPQSDTPGLRPDPDVHIYAEPSEPANGFKLSSHSHDYAELESCDDRNQDSATLAAPLPYEVPLVVGVDVTISESGTHSTTSHGAERHNVTSQTNDHQYATLDPGLPS